MRASVRNAVLSVTVAGLFAAAVSSAVQAQAVTGPERVSKPAPGADGKPLTFAVASVHRNVSGVGVCDAEHFFVTPAGFRMYNCPIYTVLLFAEVPSDGTTLGFSTDGRTVGVPGWMQTETYDIDARLEEEDLPAWQDPARQKQMFHALLKTLLEERCRLVVHREMRERPVYHLVIAKNGPKLTPAAATVSADIAAKHPDAGAVPGSAGMYSLGSDYSVTLYGAAIRTLTTLLSNRAGRVVVDKTGLTGLYDMHLGPPPGNVDAPDPGPSVFAEVQDKLGLKLEPAKEPVETLVIDSIERPSEN